MGEFVRKRWHWIITIAWREGRFWEMTTSEGTCAPLPGASRQQLFNHLHESAIRRGDAPESSYVVFFALEPDELVPDDGAEDE
ncbi:hypothetical protein GCM10023084_05420 [Streptomyces lacrimifluminis]|uniref:Uncharacterized protein n=1 Tax=Streptomyces lacrimifluminis TaxID=1500077 RepID=A0A917KSQ4_9ACTN|nr:hypothetical protein [Streptomyces lacrimifluminis]GGJ22828.1 hypothetical protein GCM10012282_19160 [Streptomyces lacrimifluminis]